MHWPGKLCIGVHRDVEVTDALDVARAGGEAKRFAARCPSPTAKVPGQHWQAFAQLVLDAAYEATMLEGVLNARRGVSNVVLLTLFGGRVRQCDGLDLRGHPARGAARSRPRTRRAHRFLWAAVGGVARVGEGGGVVVRRALAPLPAADAAWPDLERFCALIAGPAGDPRPIDELAAIARQVEADMGAASVDDFALRRSTFAGRSARWNDGEDPDDERAARVVLDELRRRGAAASEPGAGAPMRPR